MTNKPEFKIGDLVCVYGRLGLVYDMKIVGKYGKWQKIDYVVLIIYGINSFQKFTYYESEIDLL